MSFVRFHCYSPNSYLIFLFGWSVYKASSPASWSECACFCVYFWRRCSCNRHTHICWMQSPVFAFSKTFFTRSLKAFILEIPFYFTTRVTNFTRSLKAFILSPARSITGPMMVLPHEGDHWSIFHKNTWLLFVFGDHCTTRAKTLPKAKQTQAIESTLPHCQSFCFNSMIMTSTNNLNNETNNAVELATVCFQTTVRA